MKEKNILVVGGGAIGGMTAAHLVEADYHVTLYDTDKAHVDHINADGLFIEGLHQEKRIAIPSTTELSGTFDIVFLSVKSIHTKTAVKSLLPHLKDSSFVVSLQNGINEDIIADMIGANRTIGAVVGWGCTNVGPGHLKQTSEGKNIIGMLDGSITDELKEIKAMLETFTKTDITTNIYGHLWTKLLINCNVAPVGVSFGSDVKDLINDKRLIPIMIGLTNELVTVAWESGVSLEKFEDVLDVDLLKVNSFEDYKRAVFIMKMAGEQHKGIKSTIWQDIEKGRKTEIDHLNGYIEKKAVELGISTPINAALIDLVKQIENGEKQPSIDNINEFYGQVRIPKKWQAYEYDSDPMHPFLLFDLPCHQKQKQAADITGAHLIGAIIAFSKAFDKLTTSIIGKIFIRKKTWDIVTFIVNSYLREMGKNYAEKVVESFHIKKNDVVACCKVMVFYLNNLCVDYSIPSIKNDEICLHIQAESDPFAMMAKNLGVESHLYLPFFESFFQGIVDTINTDLKINCSTELLDGCKIYKVALVQ